MRMMLLLLLLLLLPPLQCASAFAAELSPDHRRLIEGFHSHRRVAAGYLRTGNGDLGAVEIERLRDTLIADRNRLVPPVDLSFTLALARTEALVATALDAVNGGDIERSRALLDEARQPLDAWRETNGIRLFSDCIAEMSAAHASVDVYRLNPPDWANAALGPRIVAAGNRILAVLDRCEREAGEGLRNEPEFRRLFDGMRASLRQVPDAVAARDGALLHRLLIEQRSFEQLLTFRYG